MLVARTRPYKQPKCKVFMSTQSTMEMESFANWKLWWNDDICLSPKQKTMRAKIENRRHPHRREKRVTFTPPVGCNCQFFFPCLICTGNSAQCIKSSNPKGLFTGSYHLFNSWRFGSLAKLQLTQRKKHLVECFAFGGGFGKDVACPELHQKLLPKLELSWPMLYPNAEHFPKDIKDEWPVMRVRSTVLDGQLSQEQDSAHVIGHAIPAVLCRNQYAVLCDMMPTDIEFSHGVWSVITFNWLGFGWTLRLLVHQPDWLLWWTRDGSPWIYSSSRQLVCQINSWKSLQQVGRLRQMQVLWSVCMELALSVTNGRRLVW